MGSESTRPPVLSLFTRGEGGTRRPIVGIEGRRRRASSGVEVDAVIETVETSGFFVVEALEAGGGISAGGGMMGAGAGGGGSPRSEIIKGNGWKRNIENMIWINRGSESETVNSGR